MLLGDAFLRNVYALFDYGQLSSSATTVSDAFIQLLPRTDPQLAVQDFESSRQTVLQKAPKEATAEQVRESLGSAAGSDEGAGDGDGDSGAGTPSGSGSAAPEPSSSSGAKRVGAGRGFVMGVGAMWSVFGLVTCLSYFFGFP